MQVRGLTDDKGNHEELRAHEHTSASARRAKFNVRVMTPENHMLARVHDHWELFCQADVRKHSDVHSLATRVARGPHPTESVQCLTPNHACH